MDTHKSFQAVLDALSDYCLLTANQYNYCTDEDMVNSINIFMKVFSALAFDHMQTQDLTLEQQGMLMEEFGKNFRQTILLGTGIDVADTVSGWPSILS